MDQDTDIEIGARLRRAREQQGKTLRDVAAVTKISVSVLAAIERNDLRRVPGGLYTRGYLRAFAAEVGLDLEPEIVSVARPVEEAEQRGQTPFPRASLAIAAAAGTVIVAALAMYLNEPPRQLPSSPLTDAAAVLDIPVVAARIPSPALHPPKGGSHVAAVVETAPPIQIEVLASAPCWLEATADGELVIYELMDAGERATIDAEETLLLRVGDPSAIVYRINGVAGRALGPAGRPVTVEITEESLRRLLVRPDVVT